MTQDVAPMAKVTALPPLSMGIPDAALYLGTSEKNIRYAIDHEELPAVRIGPKGGRWSIYVEDLKAWRANLPRDIPQ